MDTNPFYYELLMAILDSHCPKKRAKRKSNKK